MLSVELIAIQDSLILRARGSELLILPLHVVELKQFSQPREFIAYFLHEALVNRSARKLLEAWLRKDQTLWKRVHQKVQEIEISDATKNMSKELAEKSKEPKKTAIKAGDVLKGQVIKHEETKKPAAKKQKVEAKSEPKKEEKKPHKNDLKKPSTDKKSDSKKETVEKTTKKAVVVKKPAAKAKPTSTKKK